VVQQQRAGSLVAAAASATAAAVVFVEVESRCASRQALPTHVLHEAAACSNSWLQQLLTILHVLVCQLRYLLVLIC
jgi:hypothetical protein